MALTDVENIYLGRDNSIDFVLYADSTAVDLSAVTAIWLRVGDVVVKSTDKAAGYIRWAQAGYATGEVRIFAGGVTGLSTGRFTGSLMVIDPTNTTGVVWDDNIPLRVIADPLTT